MPPPSQLAIATSSVNRLLKEEDSYHKELAKQEADIKTLEEKIKNSQSDEDGNGKYMLKQQVRRVRVLWAPQVLLTMCCSELPRSRQRPFSNLCDRDSPTPRPSWRSRSP